MPRSQCSRRCDGGRHKGTALRQALAASRHKGSSLRQAFAASGRQVHEPSRPQEGSNRRASQHLKPCCYFSGHLHAPPVHVAIGRDDGNAGGAVAVRRVAAHRFLRRRFGGVEIAHPQKLQPF